MVKVTNGHVLNHFYYIHHIHSNTTEQQKERRFSHISAFTIHRFTHEVLEGYEFGLLSARSQVLNTHSNTHTQHMWAWKDNETNRENRYSHLHVNIMRIQRMSSAGHALTWEYVRWQRHSHVLWAVLFIYVMKPITLQRQHHSEMKFSVLINSALVCY